MSGREFSTASIFVTSIESSLYVRLALPTDFFKQRFADLIMHSNMPPPPPPPPPPGGLLQIERPLNTEFSKVFLHLGFVEHTLDDLTGGLESLGIVRHNLRRHSSNWENSSGNTTCVKTQPHLSSLGNHRLLNIQWTCKVHSGVAKWSRLSDTILRKRW